MEESRGDLGIGTSREGVSSRSFTTRHGQSSLVLSPPPSRGSALADCFPFLPTRGGKRWFGPPPPSPRRGHRASSVSALTTGMRGPRMAVIRCVPTAWCCSPILGNGRSIDGSRTRCPKGRRRAAGGLMAPSLRRREARRPPGFDERGKEYRAAWPSSISGRCRLTETASNKTRRARKPVSTRWVRGEDADHEPPGADEAGQGEGNCGLTRDRAGDPSDSLGAVSAAVLNERALSTEVAWRPAPGRKRRREDDQPPSSPRGQSRRRRLFCDARAFARLRGRCSRCRMSRDRPSHR